MKLKWVILPALFYACCLASPLSAQEKSTPLRDLSERLGIEWQARRAEAESLAASLYMPVRRDVPGGATIELQRFENGRPLYHVTHNDNSSKTISSNLVYPFGVAGYFLTGTGTTLGEWDAGGVRASHQEFGPRVLHSEGTLHYHATHVAGTMMAAGVQSAARGMAYEASLKAYDWNNDLSEMAAQASGGLRVSNHSYGFLTGWDYNYFNDNKWVWFGTPSVSEVEDYMFGFYNSEARSWDVVAFNAPNYLIVKSAGNDRNEGPNGSVKHWVNNGSWDTVTVLRSKDGNSGYDCLEGPSVSKNLLTVGAVSDIPGGYASPAGVVMSSFSAWGPTDDGRVKPDVVSNGVSLYSTLDNADTGYGNLSGTSMAAPSVAGSVGLLLQHQENLHPGIPLLSSTIKAVIIHTADEAGPFPGPDYQFGWGLMNTRRAVDVMTADTVGGTGSHIMEFSLANNDTIVVDIASLGLEPLKATLCWIDPAGSPVTASLDPADLMLKNDLDLRVVKKLDGRTFAPWILNPASPPAAADTGDNVRDNVEQVNVENPDHALYSVRITHKGTLLSPPTRVSLVVTGNVDSIGPELVAPPDTIVYNLLPGASFSDSLRIFNSGDPVTAGAAANSGNFWLSLTNDTVDIVSLDTTIVHYSIDGSAWSQWTGYVGTVEFSTVDSLPPQLVVPIIVNVLGPTIERSPVNMVIDLDSAEVGYDTLTVRNTGYIPLDVVVADSTGPLPAWIVADPDTFTINPGDSVRVVLTTNLTGELPGDFFTTILLASNDSVSGPVYVPVYMNVGDRTLFQLHLNSLWNMVSLPVEPLTVLKTTLFPTATTDAFGFNGAYFQAETLETGPGYWMKFNSSSTMIVDGYMFTSDTIPVFTGWNMVGALSETVPVSAVTTSPGGIISSLFYGYGSGYTKADSLIPGRAYWVQTDQDGDIYLNVAPAAAPKALPAVPRTIDLNRLLVTDASGGSQSLTFGFDADGPALTNLPPRPPRGGFDARFSDDRSYAAISAPGRRTTDVRLLLSSPERYVTVTPVLNTGDGEKYALVAGDGTRYEIADGSPVKVPLDGKAAATVLLLVPGDAGVPSEYELDQNFPNPFNPLTTIEFALPEEAMVSIRLFNILGNEVATLVEKRYGAGKHSVEFDAGELASGVYIYTMRAGTFGMTRKMMLLR